MDQILKMNGNSQRSDWQLIKQDPGNPTPQHLKELLSHLKMINSIGLRDTLFERLTQAKMDQFAADAKVLNISRMNRSQIKKKYALFACFVP